MIPCKTFLTVAALGMLTEFLPWNQLTAAMRVFHLPQVVIFIFDTTLRYIVLLGEIARLHRAGVITVNRSCLSCHHYAPPPADGPAHCLLLGLPLNDGDLRLDCPDHLAASRT